MGSGIRGAVESLAGHDGISEDECNGPSYEEGIDESIPPVMVDGDGTVRKGTYPHTSQMEGGYSVFGVTHLRCRLGVGREVRCILPLRAGGTRFPLRPC